MKNLKTNLLSLILLSLSTLSFAQMEYGVKGGVGLSNTTIVHGVSKERVGFLAGGVAKYQLTTRNENHYLQAEVLYTTQGEYSLYKEGGDKYKAFLNYINIPIMYKYYFDDQGKDFFVEGGPQLGFKVSEKFDENEPERTNNVPKSFDLAFNIGGGYSIDRKYEINLRYQYGLIDTYDYTRWDNGTNRSSFLTLGLTYFFK
ncbi:PorT family protein [Empedobacter falsenii]|uniref:porin family protein n=1 Tax=unclassified Empedobacter TaxID=2643773 RepID=UPI002577000C|nr:MULTISPECIES: porin family protein [unclassified Empedobacter]MDM1522256.1 PorT family protein [Empedobacter sp. 225-1]MDM1542056.1 PorT family protein [Empedobacter sp. 189-2]